MKKFIVIALMILTIGVMSGCSANTKKSDTTQEKKVETTEDKAAKTTASDGSTMDMKENAKADEIKGFDQNAMPKDGDEIAVISIKDFGDVTVRFFDEIAPYGVKNFVTHAKEGYYDGLSFHRIINDFMIQGGDPQGTGVGGESIWGEPLYTETSDQACVIRGSLCYAKTPQDPSIGSQFFITQAKKVNEDMLSQCEQQGVSFTDEQKKSYLKNGGAPWLQGQYTVFGQVIDGMDVVDKVAAVAVNEEGKPNDDVIISSIKVSTYKADK